MLPGCEHAASTLTVHPRVQMLLLTRPSALLQTGTTREWMCGENIDDGAVRPRMEQEMEQERRNILELPVVSGISDMVNGKGCGFGVNLPYCSTARYLRVWWVETGSTSVRLQHTNYVARVLAGGPQ